MLQERPSVKKASTHIGAGAILENQTFAELLLDRVKKLCLESYLNSEANPNCPGRKARPTN